MPEASGMRVISVNVGQPRELVFGDVRVITGIYKEPVAGRVAVRRLNLDGDRQADLRAHGGQDKAVYLYPSEHYVFWREQFPETPLPWGMFGENLTIVGLLEAEVHIGDRFQVGSAQVQVTQPRTPCYKLGIKFGREDIIKRFLESGLTGFYCAVVEDGDVAADDRITLLSRDRHQVGVSDLTRIYKQDKHNAAALRRVLAVEALPDVWRNFVTGRLVYVTGEAGAD
jgi:MOSC domain-containing protein YiiM